MNRVLFCFATCLLGAAVYAKLPKIDPAGAFTEANTTKDAGVCSSELHAYLKKHGHHDIDSKEAERLVRAVDVDNNNSLSQAEFTKLINYRNEFVGLDEDGDLKLSCAELNKYFSQSGFSETDIKELIEEVDEDGNGTVDLDEFVYLAAIVDDFKTICADSKKEISEAQLTTYLTKNHAKLDSNDVKRLIIAADDDNNGKIDIDEFGKIFLILDEFTFHDKNNNGELSKAELETYLKATGTHLDADDLERLIKVVDEDKNGTVDLDEFAFIYVAQKAFKAADKTAKDGELDKTELASFFSKVNFSITGKDLDEVIKLVDADGNGKLDFDEFTQLLMSYKFFASFDKDKTGFLDHAEWKASPNILGKGPDAATLEAQFGFTDANGDKKITYPEFVKGFIAFKDGSLGKK